MASRRESTPDALGGRGISGISDRSTFRRFRADGSVGRAGGITVVVLPPAPGGEDRRAAAFAVPRRVGGAVVRNRLRRQLRVVVGDLCRDGVLPAGDYLLVAAPHAAGSEMTTLRGWTSDAVRRAWNRVGAS